jgi:hypothetical protein
MQLRQHRSRSRSRADRCHALVVRSRPKLSRHSHGEGGRIYDQPGGAIMDREEPNPDRPEPEEQEYRRMLAKDPWVDGTQIDSRLDRGHRR